MRGITGAILVGLGAVGYNAVAQSANDEVSTPSSTETAAAYQVPAMDFDRFVESGEKAIQERRLEEQFAKALNSPLKSPLQYEDQPLNEIVAQLSDEYNLPIIFDVAALDELAISPDTEVTLNLRNITLRQALKHIFRQPGLEDLTSAVEEGVLLITTEEKANATLSVRIYRVADLVEKYDVASSKKPYSTLISIITKNVQFDSWMCNGTGEGEIQLMEPGMLVVSQTQRVHQEIQELLGLIRLNAEEIERSRESDSTAITGDPFAF